jgi:hypothetical protein
MDDISLSEIENLRRDFDVFVRPEAGRYDPGLLERGIYPPLPVMGEYLVWGFRLVEVFRTAGLDTVRTVRLPGRLPGDPAGAVVTALKLEDRRDGYSWEEKEKLAGLIEEFGLSEADKRRIEGYVQAKGSFLAALPQYRSLPPELKNMVEAGAMDLKTAWTARSLPDKTLSRLDELAADLSFSRRRELFVMTAEITARDGLSEEGLSDFVDLLEEAAGPETTDDPVAAARRVRFPELGSLERKFAAIKDRFLAGSGIDLRAPKNFEGSRFSVSFAFETDRQLDRIIDSLKTLRDNTDELYRLLYGPLRPDLSD